jgi:hypothetical protein
MRVLEMHVPALRDERVERRGVVGQAVGLRAVEDDRAAAPDVLRDA